MSRRTSFAVGLFVLALHVGPRPPEPEGYADLLHVAFTVLTVALASWFIASALVPRAGGD